jgi:hypothetical protein
MEGEGGGAHEAHNAWPSPTHPNANTITKTAAVAAVLHYAGCASATFITASTNAMRDDSPSAPANAGSNPVALDDPKSVQRALSQVMNRMLLGKIDNERAGQLLHKLQMAISDGVER